MRRSNIIYAALSLVILIMLTACDDSSDASSKSSERDTSELGSELISSITSDIESTADPIDIAKISETVMQSIEFPDMSLLDDDRLDFFYDIPIGIIESYFVSICGSAGFPDEVALFKLRDAEDMPVLEEALNKRISVLSAAFTDYRPEEHKKIDDCVVITSSVYACLIVSSNNSLAQEIVSEYFS